MNTADQRSMRTSASAAGFVAPPLGELRHRARMPLRERMRMSIMSAMARNASSQAGSSNVTGGSARAPGSSPVHSRADPVHQAGALAETRRARSAS